MITKKNSILATSLTALVLSGCANLPNIYKNNLTVNSKEYKKNIGRELDSNCKGNINNCLENKARLRYILDEIKIGLDNFSIKTFSDKEKDIAYCKWNSENPKDILIYLNGLESHSGWFSKSAQRFSKKGITTYGIDRRGSGLNTRINGNTKDWLNDVDKTIEIAKKENPNADINLASLCFGARLSTAYAIKNPNKVDSLIYISPGFNVNVSPNPMEITSIALDCMGLQTNTSTPIKNDKMFTKNPKYLRFLKNDKLRTRAPNSDDYLDGEKLLNYSMKNLSKIKIPSLVLLAKNDKIVDINKTKKTLSKFEKEPKIIEYNTEHTIFFENNEQLLNLTKDIRAFINNNGN